MKQSRGVITLLGATLLFSTATLGAVAAQGGSEDVSAMIEAIFAPAAADHVAVVVKDERERAYLAFYRSQYADVYEIRAYFIPLRNVAQSETDEETIDSAIAAGDAAGAFDLLLRIMRLDLGAQYVSDVGLDGIHEGDVAVGSGHMRDRFHNQVFADHAAADKAYRHWLERTLSLTGGEG